jgi:hypothetical protein
MRALPRLSVLLDGEPAHLYLFTRGSYEDKQRFLCAYPELLLPEQVRERVLVAAKRLPEKIDFDYMADPMPDDLFEQAVVSAGFVPVDDDVLVGLSLPSMTTVVTERKVLEEALERMASARR